MILLKDLFDKCHLIKTVLRTNGIDYKIMQIPTFANVILGSIVVSLPVTWEMGVGFSTGEIIICEIFL